MVRGASSLLKAALRRGWWRDVDVVRGGSSTRLEGVLRRDWRGRLDVVGEGVDVVGVVSTW